MKFICFCDYFLSKNIYFQYTIFFDAENAISCILDYYAFCDTN